MDDKLVVPGNFAPSNLRLPPEMSAAMVEGDLYDICERVKEIDRNLLIVPLINDSAYNYLVAEVCADGVERSVVKVKELDARVLIHLQKLMAMPLSERIQKIEKEERRFEEQEHENQLEDLYENVGRRMWYDLERCGFIESRGVSFPKRGIKHTSD